MAIKRLVSVVGATGAQGGSVVRSLIATNKYKIRCLTRDTASEKAQALKRLSNDIELVACNINKKEDVHRAFTDSWAVFAVTDFSGQSNESDVEIKQGTAMADAAAALRIPYLIFSVLEDANKLSNGKLNVPHFSQKAQIRDYIKEKYPTLKAVYVEPGFYMQNWSTMMKPQKSTDGTMIFRAAIDGKTILHMADIEDTGLVVSKVLDDPDKYVGQDICLCGDAIPFSEIPKVFTKVTGIPAQAKSLSEEEYKSALHFLPKFMQDELYAMFQWFQEYGYYGKDKDWTTGQKLTKLNTFEQWLKKTGWKGE